MRKKEKTYDILVIGSGLSALTFIDSYLEKNKKIDVISPEFNHKKKSKINHLKKLLPPQMIESFNQVNNYFHYNNIDVNENCNFFGSLEFGGLSNYWGMQIDSDILKDIKNLKSKTKKDLVKCFIDIFKKKKLMGQIKFNKNIISNNYIKNNFYYKKFNTRDKYLELNEPILAYKGKDKNFNDLDKINEISTKFTPKNLLKTIYKKNIKFHNFVLKSIKKHKKGLKLMCADGDREKIFITKKLILGCGTAVTTKLILDYLNIYNEIKIKHHPRLFCLYLAKKKWKNKMQFLPSYFHLKLKKNKSLFTADFRPGNDLIISAVVEFKKFLYPFKFLLNLIQKNLIFSSILFNPKFSNLFIRLNKKGNTAQIYSKKNNIRLDVKNSTNIVFNFLKKINLIWPFKYTYFPSYGSDFHYFGTIPIGKKKRLSVNNNCQLYKDKNIYIIDGSVFNFVNNKYPLGVIMANARRIAKALSKNEK